MRSSPLIAALILALFTVAFAHGANLTITPTTTLAAETGNNTSTADSFVTSTNGNMGAGNVSKQPLRDLIFPGFTGKVYVNWVPWWGSSSHINIGYNSADIVEIDKQITDMMSRGVDGMIVDWWNAGAIQTATNQMKYQAENYPPFQFALMYDAAQLSGLADPTQRLINDLNFAAQNYYPSSAYMKINGRPVLLEFGLELYPIDWTRVQAGITGNPLIIFRNVGGFTRPMTAGAFAWGASDTGTSYLNYFYSTALTEPTNLFTWGSVAKGFDDSLAPWGQHRYADQQCGQHWLTQMADAGTWYASHVSRLNAMQVATWNDYEEGTAIETGIDNCVTVSATSANTTLSWAITGLENTVHHYTVFISTDGTNLMPLATVASGTHSLDLSQFQLAAGSYTLYVKAVGQASLRNQMSNAVSYSVADQTATVSLAVTPNSGIAPVNVSANATVTPGNSPIVSTTIDFGDGTTATGPTASHTYASTGNYTVRATATDASGGSASAAAGVAVVANQPPLASLSVSPSSGVAPTTVTASTAASSDPDGSIASSSINFGDGTIAAGPTASHRYAAAGTYTVTGTVTDNLGASSTATATVRVTPAGLTLTSPQPGSANPSPVHVVASAVSGNPITAIWIYVDNVVLYRTTSSTVDTYLNLSGGSHFMSAQAWDSSGQLFRQTATFTVNQLVAALSVTQSSPYAPATVSASTAGSTDSGGTIVASSIDFGDGTVVSGTTASHVYRTAGSYTVKGTVTDNHGASASRTVMVTVNAPRVVITSPTNASSQPASVHVVASAYSGAPISAVWVYVDNTVAYRTSASSLNTYITMAAGGHTVTVKAWDTMGSLFTSSVNVTVSTTTQSAVQTTQTSTSAGRTSVLTRTSY